MYLAALLENLLSIMVTNLDFHPHMPMYFFLSNLLLVDIYFTFITLPKMLVNIQTHSKAITYKGCITQIYFFTFFVVLDNFLLTVVVYEHFVTICHPLYYIAIKNHKLCLLLMLVSCATCALSSLLET
jgi:olfactory receptor